MDSDFPSKFRSNDVVRTARFFHFFVLIFVGVGLSPLAFSQTITNSENKKMARQSALQFKRFAKDRAPLFIVPPSNGEKVFIFNQPGQALPSCQAPCSLLAILPADSKVHTTGKTLSVETKSANGLPALETHVEIQFESNGEKKIGWIPLDQISASSTYELNKRFARENYPEPLESKAPSEASSAGTWWQKLCGIRPEAPFIPKASDVHSAALKAILDRHKFPQTVTTVASKIEKLVGQCVIDPPNKISVKDLKGPISYDTFVLPTMIQAPKDGSAAPIAQAQSLNIPGLNAQKLVEIDSLARTIFAEMASCIPYGAEYAMAITRVIKNREEAIHNNPNAAKEFIWEKENQMHWPGKSINTKVTSSPVQFSAWNNYIIDFDKLKAAREARSKELIAQNKPPEEAAKTAKSEIYPDFESLKFYKFNESGMLHTLCPPSDPNKAYYDGHRPTPALHGIWQNVLKIATEAVLNPEEFNKKTNQLKNVLHYTSGRKKFYDFYQVKPLINGEKIDRDQCLNLWVDPRKFPPPGSEKTSKKKKGAAK